MSLTLSLVAPRAVERAEAVPPLRRAL